MIGTELAAFLQEGVGIHIGTRNAALEPNGSRALAVKVEEDGRHLVVYVARVAAERLLPDLEANGQAAVGFGRPIDDRACQVKGRFISTRPAKASERAEVERQADNFCADLEGIGIPRALSSGSQIWPCATIQMQATELFEQTPGPGAGEPLR